MQKWEYMIIYYNRYNKNYQYIEFCDNNFEYRKIELDPPQSISWKKYYHAKTREGWKLIKVYNHAIKNTEEYEYILKRKKIANTKDIRILKRSKEKLNIRLDILTSCAGRFWAINADRFKTFHGGECISFYNALGDIGWELTAVYNLSVPGWEYPECKPREAIFTKHR